MPPFNVTYEIITQESAEHGEAEDCGFVAEDISLREAICAVFETETSHCDGVTAIEADEYPMTAPRYITVHNGMQFLTGNYENRSLHIPDNITPASRRRIARMMQTIASEIVDATAA